MISLALVCATLAAAPADADAPRAEAGARSLFARADDEGPSAASELAFRRVTILDAPTTPTQAFVASSLTSFTGLVSVVGLLVQPNPGMPGSAFSWRARLGAGLLLMSAGPSVGDLLNGDSTSFFVAAGVRTLLAGLTWLSIEGAIATSNGLLIASSVLLVAIGGLVWSGWCAADLVRSFFAPDRWVQRTNAARPNPREPIAEVRRAGGLAFVY